MLFTNPNINPTDPIWFNGCIILLSMLNLIFTARFFYFGWKFERNKNAGLLVQNQYLKAQTDAVYWAIAMLFFIDVVNYLCK